MIRRWRLGKDGTGDALTLANKLVGTLNEYSAEHPDTTDGQIDDALTCYERAIEIDPEYVEARWNRGLLRLLVGDFEAGWADYEDRRQLSWVGVQDFSNRKPLAERIKIAQRLRGTPARVQELIRSVPADRLTARPDAGWSIQQNIGHLIDLGYLPMNRIEQILGGEEVLIAVDMTNKRTNQANHNDREIAELLAELRAERGRLVARLEALSQEDWAKSALHPRIKQPMRIVDIVYFDSEHDDYHLARIRELIRTLK